MSDFEQVVAYMKAHWPSKVKEEWQVSLEEYPEILKQVVAELTEDATTGRHFVRIAGISGAGKTTQIMPGVEAYYAAHNLSPILVAARVFVKYHPHLKEIEEFYGAENVRKLTDEFSTIMMFMTLKELSARGYDMILDVTLLDPAMEKILVSMLEASQYEMLLTMIAVSPEVTARHLAGREWRHTAETEAEFIRATRLALEFYASECSEMPVLMWNAFDIPPVYQGAASGMLPEFDKWSAEPDREPENPEVRRKAKIELLEKL